MSELTLTLFGSPCLAEDGVPLRLRSRKCMALLGYLALTNTPHSRPALAALLWPESDARRAASGLRYTLTWLRNALHGQWLLTDRDTVALDGTHQQAIDVLQFRTLLAHCTTHGHASDETCPQCLPPLAQAADLYQDDFMAGFALPDSPTFDDWLLLEGQALRHELSTTLQRLAEGTAAQGDPMRAIAYAHQWLALDQLNEAAHRCLMRLYALSGRRAEALRQFDTCQETLHEALGLPPDPDTAALRQAIMEGHSLAPPIAFVPGPPRLQEAPGPARRHNLPPEPNPFVGRQDEQAHIALLLADPACRLLAIVGPGGIGKSRLALRAARDQIARFPQGVCFVPLAALPSPDLLPTTILGALDVPLVGDATAQLLHILRDRELLLVLDNFEHLLDGASLLAHILDAAPAVKILLSSRERVNLRQEWLLPLSGMDFPHEDTIATTWAEESQALWPGVASQESLAALEAHSAVQLFLQCAHRVRPDFSLATAGASWVARICQLVEGMPLAIELAAPWVRLMSCQDIARGIQAGLDFLASSLRDQPPRHRSMRAVFDHSWRLLSDGEREVLPALSVFRGGFGREAAEAVAGATLPLLASLVDSSWLRAEPSGRYTMHELVRQYCQERLDAEPEAADRIRDRHSDYYASFLQEREPALYGSGQAEAMREVLAELDNVRAAWSRAIARGDLQALGRAVDSLWIVSERRGWYHEMGEEFGRAAARLRECRLAVSSLGDPSREDVAIALARLLSCEAHHRFRGGSVEQAIACLEEALDALHGLPPSLSRQRASVRAKSLLGWSVDWLATDRARSDELLREGLREATEIGDHWGRSLSLWCLGLSAYWTGQYDQGAAWLAEGVAVSDALGDQCHKAWCLDKLSMVLCAQGEYERAKEVAEERYAISRAMGDRVGTLSGLLRVAEAAGPLGEYDLAGQHYQDVLASARQLGDPIMVVTTVNGQAALAAMRGDHAEAMRLFEESLNLEAGPWRRLTATLGLAQARLALGEGQRAQARFCEALELALGRGFRPEALAALVGLAAVAAEKGDGPRAVELLALAVERPAATHATRERARALLDGLEPQLPPETYAAAIARGRGRSVEEIAAEVLADSAV